MVFLCPKVTALCSLALLMLRRDWGGCSRLSVFVVGNTCTYKQVALLIFRVLKEFLSIMGGVLIILFFLFSKKPYF